MSAFDNMLVRNKEFAAQVSSAGTPMPSLPESLPDVKALIITCADMRVDPAYVLGVELGEAVVLRNIGGRITPGLIEQIGCSGGSARWPEQLPAEVESSTSFSYSTQIAALRGLPAIPLCWRTSFRSQKATLRRRWFSILAARLPWMWRHFERSRLCPLRG